MHYGSGICFEIDATVNGSNPTQLKNGIDLNSLIKKNPYAQQIKIRSRYCCCIGGISRYFTYY